MSEKEGPLYTEGTFHDGAAILKDGKMMTIEEVLSELNSRYKWKDAAEWRMYMDKNKPFKSQGMHPTWSAAREMK